MNRRLLFPLLAVVMMMCGIASSVRAAELVPPRHVGEAPANEATIIRLPGGELRIYYIVQPARTELRSTGSTDNGKTWGDDRLEFKLPGKAYYANQALVDADGEVHAAFHILGKGEKGYNGRHYDVWHAKTTGGRKTWGEPKRIFEGYVGSMRGFAQLKSGRLLIPAGVAVPARQKKVDDGKSDYGWNDVAVFYSDDQGDTWNEAPKRLSILQDNTRGRTRYGAVEPQITELADGRAWMLIRTKNGFLYESLSPDGIDWTDAKPSKFISSDSPATTARLKDGRLALFLNASQRWDDPMSYAIGGREVLHGAISSDEGKTWQGFREVLYDFAGAGKGDRGTAYPSAVETADGMIALVSGQGEGRKSILRVDPNWLAETSASSTFAQDAWPQWTTHEGKGGEIIEHPEKKGARCLFVRQVDPKAIAGATWNFPMVPAGKLALRVKPKAGSGGATIALTDHYSVTGDTRADENPVYHVALDEKSLPAGAWHDVAIAWQAGGDAAVTVNGNAARTVTPKRKTAFGINYVRLSSGDENGFLVESASAEAASSRATAAAGAQPVRVVAFGDSITKGARPARGGAPAVAAQARNLFMEATRRVAKETDSPLVDHFALWSARPADEVDALLPDGCHPNAAGHDVLADAILPVIVQTLKPATRTGPSLEFKKVRGSATGGAVLDVGGAGAFDERWATCPSVLRERGGYRMWYSAHFNAQSDLGGIGLATSSDGVRWSRQSSGKPVLPIGPAGAFDDAQVFGPHVLHDGKRYLMWYTGDAGDKHDSGIFGYQIGLATSADGMTWTRANDGRPVLQTGPAGASDEVQAATPSVLRDDDGGYRMWYAAWSPKHNHTICVARSADGIAWTRENGGKPVEGLNPSIAYGHSVARFDDRYVMLYMALEATRNLYGATSVDGTRWTMLNDGSPLISTGAADDFDANIIGHPHLLVEGGTLRAWYTGYQTKPGGIANWELRIGLARAPLATAPLGTGLDNGCAP